MKKLLLILTVIVCSSLCLQGVSIYAASDTIFNKCSGANCLLQGVNDAGKKIGNVGLVTGVGIGEAVQNFIVYLLGFLSLIAIIYIMYAGAQLLLKPADEESATKTKKIIVGVISGIVIIWFAWWIVSSIFYVLNTGSKKAFIPMALAETQIRNVDFTTFSNKIESLETKISAAYSSEIMTELSMLVDGAYDHMPDRADLYKNKQLYDAVKKAIEDYNLRREVIDRGILQTALRNFLEGAELYDITAEPEATPRTGDAPLSVTLEAKKTIDESGTIIPNDNYVWWLRAEGGIKKIIGRGNIMNYTFDNSGTYMVFLTINSASKNSRGFTDVISFEESLVIEVGQPKVQFVLKLNDQRVNKVFKVSTKEAIKPIRIDASETRFASGYTTTSTEWDFGNGNTDTNEGDPQFESQIYPPGEHTLRLKLIRNDGEEFVYSVLIKVGDPLAAISTTNMSPSKGENVTFQAKKTSNENDIQYLWEIKKQGIERVMYTASGTRMEYSFGDTGKFFVTLTSIKGDARDKDTIEITVESRPPNVQFTSEVVSSELPNVYFFDGSNSFDPDYPDNQKLRFEWFVNDVAVQLSETNTKNSRGKYTFPEKGVYRVTLRVTDEEGKMKESKRDIRITSILSVRLDLRSEVIRRGDKAILTVTAPHAKTYEWKIGNGDIIRTENNRFVTSFSTSGTFSLEAIVTDIEGNQNTATKEIYVTEDEQPFAIIDIKSDSNLTSSQKNVCSGEEAITLDRASPVSFSSDKSINRDGKENNLTYFWKIGFNKTSTQKNVSYTFDELGCEEISLTVADKITGASHTTKKWVKIVNIAPVFSDIQVTVENLDMDPMKINLKLLGARDPDGVIRSYTWYYYTDRDEQPQGFRITRLPEVNFILPKITGRYYFAVLMEDSNGLKINTKEVSDVLFSTPDLYVNTNLSTPIIENFKADTSEVNFGDTTRLSLDVRTPVATDVSDKSEYRWDIDGDGFYDVKTSTPSYEFKYIYPGEYNPKVKVTHKGISATKSLTITVKNSLVPKATVQIIGNKIIAYNVSSGIFQSANWYLDNKKISENKEYLIAEMEGSGLRNLKLEISDGKTTESVVYSIQPSLKNKVLLKKISRSLIVLSPLSGGNIGEVPDEIVWEDPMNPLYLYLGESRGDIRYYVIDTDIDIDTDLSGGKDDDADNKGTASYRSGRPFQIPKGTKKITTMKIRLIGNNNQDLDVRQIRIVRKFLAAAEPNVIEDTKAPKVFHLSQDDKDRIEKLRNLVQSAPEEERKEFNKILDQLGDNWYDVAERIQTLNLFSNMVNASPTLSADLKKKILEQISLVYTQGDDKIEEKQLALKMITEYLAKSPKKLQIFGDAETPGLINEIIDNPEYYEANLKIIQKIMDDYVDPDTTLSQEVKKDIREKLMILAGSPPAPIESQTSQEVTSGNRWTLLLWVLGGVVCVIFGGIGIIYARQRLGEQKMPDMAIAASLPKEVQQSVQQDNKEDVNAKTPDWLKEDGSPFGSEDVFVENGATTPDDHQPDWLQDAVKEPEKISDSAVSEKEEPKESLVSTPENIVATNTDKNVIGLAEEEASIPDWLQSSPQGDNQQTGTPESLSEKNNESENNHTTEEPDETPVGQDIVKDDDIPDWLRGADIEKENISLNEVIALPVTEEGVEKNILQDDFQVIVKEEMPHINGENQKTETIEKMQGEELLESPTHLIASSEDSLLSPPKKVKKTQKRGKSQKPKVVPSDHLLESEHDMLLPPQNKDTPL